MGGSVAGTSGPGAAGAVVGLAGGTVAAGAAAWSAAGGCVLAGPGFGGATATSAPPSVTAPIPTI
ncbi:MAG TPA: hypothetical protein VN180_09940, partial [Acidimicrobiia bacterium]|nr:hypothetical protein [Acidimicrobiia bacterium]